MANRSSVLPVATASRPAPAAARGELERWSRDQHESPEWDLARSETTGTAVQELEKVSDAPRVIVVAVNASTSAAEVVSSAIRMARGSTSAAIHILYVFPTSRFDHARAGVPATPARVIEEAREQRLDARVRAARRQSGAQVVGHFVLGDPARETLRLCEEVDADLLVIGSHVHRGLERLLCGSIAATLVRKAPCTVLVTRLS